MIDEIFKAVGILYAETQFLRTPAETHAVYMDDVTTDGPDGLTRIFSHNITVELYEHKPDPATEAALEREFNARGIKWYKQARYWLKDAQLYQVIYEDISYIEKI